MDLSPLPRSVRWRIQLGVYKPLDPALIHPTTSAKELLQMVYETNKDVIHQQTERFDKLMETHVEEAIPENENTVGPECGATEGEATGDSAPLSNAAPEIDPLTAMVMEQDAIETRKAELLLKYKKERARRKRGLSTEDRQIAGESDGVDEASLVIIEKDLKRLPHPTSKAGAASGNPSPAEETRIGHLKEILYIYAQEHPAIGYRQGMHEIASYLLFCLELEQPKFPDDPLFDSILTPCFFLLEKTLQQLHLAYDASGEQSLQRLSNAILGKIHQNDFRLYNHLANSPNIPPPPIYCTRWVRLLFSREVVGYENVFKLWDVFFEYNNNVMRALEVTSSARILMLRDALFNPENNPLDLLMNMPQLEDTAQLTDLLRQLMQQTETDQPINLPSLPNSDSDPVSTNMIARQANSGEPGRNFSFSKMKKTIGQKGESLRQKLITATNEWKRENSMGSSGASFTGPTETLSSAGEILRSNIYKPTETVVFSDPLMNPTVGAAMAAPPSPQKHQHAKWSELLNQRILTVQNFLMSVEAKEKLQVPPDVWEAMADMQRVQQELLNYSRNMT